jgi:hypothetical protein
MLCYVILFNTLKYLLILVSKVSKKENKYLRLFGWGTTSYNQIISQNIVVVHTKLKAPDPIRTPKLSDFRHG